MLKTAIVCVMLASTAALAWAPRQDVPHYANLPEGTQLTWGNGLVWGIFPTNDAGHYYTYVFAFYPAEDSWDESIPAMDGTCLDKTSITFEWIEGVLYGIGLSDTSRLYWYVPGSCYWHQDTIDSFVLDNGASIAYQPNVNYNSQMNPVPGWIYCLVGSGRGFWRYAIPTSLPNVALDGIYPGQGAAIADQTPLFQWGGEATNQYRLQVSTNSLFSQIVIDEVVSDPEYQATTALANGAYHWRSAAYTDDGWSWSGTHDFDLDGGWTRLDSIPSNVGLGSIIAYDGGSLEHQAILAFTSALDYFYEYNIAQGAWTQLEDAPDNVTDGASLTTSDPVGVTGNILASFINQNENDVPYRYHPIAQGGKHWVDWYTGSADPDLNSHFPENVEAGSSMILGEQEMFMTFHDGHDFYRVVYAETAEVGGQQAGAAKHAGARAHAIATCDGIEVEYQLPVAARVRATLHDAVGRRVDALDRGDQKAGLHRIGWDQDGAGRKLSAGAYFVILDMGTEQIRLKAVVK